MNRIKTLFLFLCIGFGTYLHGQVNSVYYQLAFVDSTNHYQMNLVIADGSATSVFHRIQFNAQYSLVFPESLTFNFVDFFMPLQNNNSYTGTIPAMYNEISTDDTLGNTYLSIAPSLSPTAAYNNVFAGDTIPLFTFDLGGFNSDIRLYENGVDLDASQFNSGVNYSQGFTMGSPTQLYDGNLPTKIIEENNPPVPEDPLFHVGDEFTSGNRPLHIGEAIDTPNVSSILELESVNKGFLPPRMTTAQVLGIENPEEGLTVYCTTVQMLVFYTGTIWRRSDGQNL